MIIGFQHLDSMQFDSLFFSKDFEQWVQWIEGSNYSGLNF